MDHPKVIPAGDLAADQALIRRGVTACRTQKALAEVCGCSERLISNVMQGKRRLPREPLPLLGKTPRELIEAAIAAGGNVPKVHRGPGNFPRASTRVLRIPVTAEEKAAIDVVDPDANDAVMAWITRCPKTPPDRPWAADAFPPVPADATVTLHRALTPRVHDALLAYLDGETVLRDRCVRAALRFAVGFDDGSAGGA